MTDSPKFSTIPLIAEGVSCERWVELVEESIRRDSDRLFGVGNRGKLVSTFPDKVALQTEGSEQTFYCSVSSVNKSGVPHLVKTEISEGSKLSRSHLLTEVRGVVDAILTDRIDEGASALMNLGSSLQDVPAFDSKSQLTLIREHVELERPWRTFYDSKLDMVKEAIGDQPSVSEPKFPAFYSGTWSPGEIHRHSGVLEDSWKTLISDVQSLFEQATEAVSTVQKSAVDQTIVDFGEDLLSDLQTLSEALENMHREVHDPSALAQGYDVVTRRLKEYENATRFLNQLAANAVVNQ